MPPKGCEISGLTVFPGSVTRDTRNVKCSLTQSLCSPCAFCAFSWLTRMFHTDFLRMGGTGYQPVLVGNLPTRLGRAPCRDEEMRREKFDFRRAGSPAGCPCHPTAVKFPG